MSKYRVNPNFVIRKYGSILLGYFKTDEKLRYYSFEGTAAQCLESVMLESQDSSSGAAVEQDRIYNRNFKKELLELIKLTVIEVT